MERKYESLAEVVGTVLRAALREAAHDVPAQRSSTYSSNDSLSASSSMRNRPSAKV